MIHLSVHPSVPFSDSNPFVRCMRCGCYLCASPFQTHSIGGSMVGYSRIQMLQAWGISHHCTILVENTKLCGSATVVAVYQISNDNLLLGIWPTSADGVCCWCPLAHEDDDDDSNETLTTAPCRGTGPSLLSRTPSVTKALSAAAGFSKPKTI